MRKIFPPPPQISQYYFKPQSNVHATSDRNPILLYTTETCSLFDDLANLCRTSERNLKG